MPWPATATRPSKPAATITTRNRSICPACSAKSKRSCRKQRLPVAPIEAVASGAAELLSKLRHDLKTPLNQIIGYGEMLLEDPESASAESTILLLKRLLESGHGCLDVQSRS